MQVALAQRCGKRVELVPEVTRYKQWPGDGVVALGHKDLRPFTGAPLLIYVIFYPIFNPFYALVFVFLPVL